MIKSIKIIFFISCIIASIILPAKADHIQHLFEQGNQFYQQNQYQKAIETYQEILNNGYENWQLYYNLGNAYFKSDQIGRAVINYERALKLNPKHEDICFNLQLANLRVVDNIVVPNRFFLVAVFDNIKNFLGIAALTWLTIIFFLSFMVLIIIRLLVRDFRLQRVLKPVLIIVATIWIVVSIIFLIRIHEESTVQHGIILAPRVVVLGAPSQNSTELFSLHEGVKFKIEEYSGDWAKIRLTDGKVGWVEKDVFDVI